MSGMAGETHIFYECLAIGLGISLITEQGH